MLHNPPSARQQRWPHISSFAIDIPVTNVCANLAVSAQRYPEKTAIDYYGATLSYRQLWRRVCQMAGYLQQVCQVAPGDRVLLNMQSSPAFVVAYYAILRAGAVVVPVNPMNTAEEIRWLVTDTGARVACIAQERLPVIQPLCRDGLLSHGIVSTYADDLPPSPTQEIPSAIAARKNIPAAPGLHDMAEAFRLALEPAEVTGGGRDLAVIVYTSGTTGRPKGCMLSHYALNANLVNHAWLEFWTPAAVTLACAPFFHVTGMIAAMNTPLFAGAKIIILSRWDRQLAAQILHAHEVSHWVNIPTMVIDLLTLADLARYDLSGLRFIGGGGASMPEAVANKLKAITGLEYQEGWGLTEVSGGIHMNPPHRVKRQSIGVPLCNVDSRVLDIASGQLLGPHEKGEIITRCPSLFSGYWNNLQATDNAFMTVAGERYFRTGDIGHYDEDGYFFISDRLKRMINVAGFKVWPAEVESILYRHDDIKEACVIAVNDPRSGEQVKAFIVKKDLTNDGLTAEIIMQWARQHMAAYKVPRHIQFLDNLPKSATGKVLWKALQQTETAPDTR